MPPRARHPRHLNQYITMHRIRKAAHYFQRSTLFLANGSLSRSSRIDQGDHVLNNIKSSFIRRYSCSLLQSRASICTRLVLDMHVDYVIDDFAAPIMATIILCLQSFSRMDRATDPFGLPRLPISPHLAIPFPFHTNGSSG